jgi:3'(2'), 5'-bisphosphate nucleotidase
MIDHLVEIAEAAGDIILDIYGRDDVGAVRKEDGSPVTLADEAAEALILERLGALFPDLPVVAEEAAAAGNIPDVAERFFLVDPLDGTKEFVSRNGEFTVNIALIEQGRVTAGVVHAPALGTTYTGDADGARRRDRGGDWEALVARKAPAAGLVVIASRSHAGADTDAYLGRFEIAERVAAGSSLKLCRVAEGAADLYPRLGRTMAWDIAAGHAVLEAAGGFVRVIDGAPFTYHPDRVEGDDSFANPWFIASGAFDPETLAREAA